MTSTNDLYISEYNKVRMVSESTGALTTVAGTGSSGFTGDGGPATTATLNTPNGLWVSSITGNLFVADFDNNVIRMVDGALSGTISTVVGTGIFGFDGSAELPNVELANAFILLFQSVISSFIDFYRLICLLRDSY